MPNSLVERIVDYRALALEKLKALEPVALLLGRLAVGLVFMSTGWGKVHDLEKVTQFFVTLGIPMPGLNAVVVGYTELLGGTALVLGVLTRLAAIPLIVSMVVAIATAKKDELGKSEGVSKLFTLFGFDEWTYLLVMVMIVILGPGRYAIDSILAKRLEAEKKT
ncbi:MAG TPA: DoxX family protein [Labilithrix sp.]